MTCYYPLRAYKTPLGVFFSPGSGGRPFQLPCGQCIGCKIARSESWAVRILHESMLHPFSSFVTLTYDESHMPYGGTLHYPHIQDFLKRLRHRFSGLKIRHFTVGEYGDRFGRPHYHSILFGAAFPDRYAWRESAAGFPLFRSPLLEKVWSHGSVEIGDVSYESAAYCARYCCKKINGDMAEEHYARCVESTGEIIQIPPELMHCSRDPPIGGAFFLKYMDEILGARDGVVVEGRVRKVPRAYERLVPELLMRPIKDARIDAAVARGFDAGYDRLRVREAVTRARYSFKQRSLE